MGGTAVSAVQSFRKQARCLRYRSAGFQPAKPVGGTAVSAVQNGRRGQCPPTSCTADTAAPPSAPATVVRQRRTLL